MDYINKMKRFFLEEHGGVLVEGAIAGSVSLIIFTMLMDLLIAMSVASSVEYATSRASRTMSLTRSLPAATESARQAVLPFAKTCINVQAHWWPTISGVDPRSTTGGVAFTGMAPYAASLARIQVSCTWNWLTPQSWLVFNSGISLRRISGVGLE